MCQTNFTSRALEHMVHDALFRVEGRDAVCRLPISVLLPLTMEASNAYKYWEVEGPIVYEARLTTASSPFRNGVLLSFSKRYWLT